MPNQPQRAPCRRAAFIVAVVLVLLAAASLPLVPEARAADESTPCGPSGHWVDGHTREVLGAPEAAKRLAAAEVVLLGEIHEKPMHHRWQLHTLAALHGRSEVAAVGFEMLPRDAQEVLDRWVGNELSIEEFLEQSSWAEVWGFEPDSYRELLEFVRLNRVPARAINVERRFVREVGREGWDAAQEMNAADIGRPAPPPAAYRERLRHVFEQHGRSASDDDGVERFVTAQTVWDRAMAEALAEEAAAGAGLVVGLVGRGHVEHGHGIPHQLGALGDWDVRTALALEAGAPCPDDVEGRPAADLYFMLRGQ